MMPVMTKMSEGRAQIHVSLGNRPDLYWSPAWELRQCDQCQLWDLQPGRCPTCGGRTRFSRSGGSNSYVIAKNEPFGNFLTADGQKVDLLSINGAGEVRWACRARDVQTYCERLAQGKIPQPQDGDFVETYLAATYFGLVPNPR